MLRAGSPAPFLLTVVSAAFPGRPQEVYVMLKVSLLCDSCTLSCRDPESSIGTFESDPRSCSQF